MISPGGKAAARNWAAHDLRRRWLALVALGLLAGVTAGFAVAALAGARRTGTALARLRAQTLAADAVVFPSQVGALTPDFAALAARPEVKAVAPWDLLFGDINGQPGGLLFGSDDGTFFNTVDRPVVVKGRMYNPDAPDEMVVDENATSQAPLGSTLTFRPQGPEQASRAGSVPATGPTLTLHVVGVVREVDEFLFVSQGQAFVSPALIRQHRAAMLILPNAEITLAPGGGGIVALQQDVNTLLAPGTPLLDLHEVSRRVTTTLAVERVAMLLLAAAVALAGGFLVAQALVRSAGVIGDDAPALRAIGMARSEVGRGGTLPHVLSALVTAATAFATAALASAAFPVGFGRRIDPAAGFHLDWTVIAPGIGLAVLAVLATARAVASRTYTAPGDGATEPSQLGAWIRRRAPVSVGLGAGMAFERGGGSRRVPSRPALIGATVGILGLVATLTINQAIAHALAHPELAGVTWDAGVTPDPASLTPRGIDPALSAAVQAAAGTGAAVAIVDRYVLPAAGRGAAIGVPAFSFRTPGGTGGSAVGLTVTSGRAPARDGEAALGPATARDLRVHLGDSVRIGEAAVPVRVVGMALFSADVHAEFDQGLWLTPGQYDAVVPPLGDTLTEGDVDRVLAVHAGGAATPAATVQRLQAALRSFRPAPQDISSPSLPPELANLRNVRVLPAVLAAFLALVAVGAVSHVLVTATRRRRRDFAVLRSLGMTRGGTRMVINAQSTAIGLTGLVVGIPLGLAAGRAGWRLVAQRVPLAVEQPLPLAAVLVLIPAAMLTINALAVWPGRRVARRGLPAEALRAE